MKTTRTCSLLLALLLNVLGASAFAYDSKVMGAAGCNPSDGSKAAAFSTLDRYISNNNTVTVSVNCPVVRDRVSNTDGTEAAFAYVASSGGQTLTCILYSYTPLGGVIASDSESTTSNIPVSLFMDVNTSANLGYYVISCFLPPGGKVYGYRVQEFEPTDGNN